MSRLPTRPCLPRRMPLPCAAPVASLPCTLSSAPRVVLAPRPPAPVLSLPSAPLLARASRSAALVRHVHRCGVVFGGKAMNTYYYACYCFDGRWVVMYRTRFLTSLALCTSVSFCRGCYPHPHRLDPRQARSPWSPLVSAGFCRPRL